MHIEPLEILKWIAIVLAAGFVGYFGRYLAMLVIEKVRRDKPAAADRGESSSGLTEIDSEGRRLKLGKKLVKQQVKKAKKEASK